MPNDRNRCPACGEQYQCAEDCPVTYPRARYGRGPRPGRPSKLKGIPSRINQLEVPEEIAESLDRVSPGHQDRRDFERLWKQGFSHRLRELRYSRNLSQTQVCKMMDSWRSKYAEWEGGHAPSLPYFAELIVVLGLNDQEVRYLLGLGKIARQALKESGDGM